jgi:phosphate transport system substrate-binding protein
MNTDLYKRRSVQILLGAATLGVAGAIFGAIRVFHRANKDILLIAGSGMMSALNQDLANAYTAKHPQANIMVEGGGSVAGLIALKRGAIDIAAYSQALPENEDDLLTRSFMLARNSISFIVNRSAGVSELSQAQIQDILQGKIDNWKLVGGQDIAIQVLTRDKASSTREFVEDIVLQQSDIAEQAHILNSADELLETVARDPRAIAYVSQQEMNRHANFVTHIKVDGVEFSRASVLSGSYPYTQDLFYVCYGDIDKKLSDFLQYVRSIQAKEIIEQHNLVSLY